MNRSKLSKAISECDVETVQQVLATEQCLANELNPEGYTPIGEWILAGEQRGEDDYATRRGEILHALISHGADINAKCKPQGPNVSDGSDRTPVMLAAEKKSLNSKSIQMLVQNGADLHIAANDGKTALMIAIERGNDICARYLIQCANTELLNHQDSDGRTALMWAIDGEEGNALSLCQQLLAAGADLDIADKDGKNALMYAISKDRFSCARSMIQYTTPEMVNRQDDDRWTALMLLMVCRKSHHVNSLCLELVAAGANVNIAENCCDTALLLAIEHDHVSCARLFIEHSTPEFINHRGCAGETALLRASGCEEEVALSLCKHLLEAGADMNVAGDDGMTALINAIAYNNYKCIRLFVENSTPALINHKDCNGMTALMWAIESQEINNNVIAKLLLEAGAEVTIKDKKWRTALEMAAEAGREQIVSLLLDKGAVVNTISMHGKTPLYYAVSSGVTMVNQLLSHGADPTLSVTHETLVHRAIELNNPALVRTLIMSGFPPRDCTYPRDDMIWLEEHNDVILNDSKWPVSPLALALLRAHPSVAHYLIANRYFAPSDLEVNGDRYSDILEFLEAHRPEDCAYIFESHSRTVQSLFTLCTVTITSALTEDLYEDNFVCDRSDGAWSFRPTYRERVERLGLPGRLVRSLLHQTPESRICCGLWWEIPLDGARHFPECKDCDYCQDKAVVPGFPLTVRGASPSI